MVLTAIERSIAGDLHNWLIVSVYRARRRAQRLLLVVAENRTKRAVLFVSASTLVPTVGQNSSLVPNSLLSAIGMLLIKVRQFQNVLMK